MNEGSWSVSCANGQAPALYLEAVQRVGSILALVESWLEDKTDGALIRVAAVQAAIGVAHATYDQCALALEGLASLGVLPTGGGALNKACLLGTTDFRAGVRAMATHLAVQDQIVLPRLLVAMPEGMPAETELLIRKHADDLRATVLDLIASARREILLASPFWDLATATDLGPLLARRAAAGILVRILARPPSVNDNGLMVLAGLVRSAGPCRIATWYAPTLVDTFGAQTFHFKCVVADQGAYAYLGSANLTQSGLRSRMELGVVVTGELAARLGVVLEAAWSMARPWE